MKLLTVYILYSGDVNYWDFDRTVRSLVGGDVSEEDFDIEVLKPGTDFNLLVPNTKWKMFLYSDEWLSKHLLETLPIYLTQDQYNVLSVFRMKDPGRIRTQDDERISVCPRIFHSDIPLKPDSLVPDEENYHSGTLKYTRVFDGFVFGEL